MIKKYLANGQIVIMLFIYSFVLGSWLFYKGYQVGWEGYKHSRNMQYALDSAFQYGIWQCEDEYGLTK